MGRKTKKYEELTIVDDFMFGKVMRSPKRCRKLLEIILGVKIRKIVFLDDQDTMAPDYDAKGIRMDIYVGDGTEILFLNMKGILDDADEELQNLLEYFDSQVPRDEYTKELDDAVEDAKLHKEWRREYMKMEVLEYINRSQGREEGRLLERIQIVCRKIAKQKAPEEITEDLDEDLEEIRRIYDVAVKYTPDYDAEAIYEELSAETDMDTW